MPYVYILKSKRDGRFYVGSTKNFGQRMDHHLRGHTASTRRFGELEIVLTQKYDTLEEARRIEVKLKKLKRHDYIDKIVKEKVIKIRP